MEYRINLFYLSKKMEQEKYEKGCRSNTMNLGFNLKGKNNEFAK